MKKNCSANLEKRKKAAAPGIAKGKTAGPDLKRKNCSAGLKKREKTAAPNIATEKTAGPGLKRKKLQRRS